MAVGADYFTNLDNFYKVLTPTDLFGKTKQVDTKNYVTLQKEVYENYLVGVYSGDEIIKNLSGKTINGIGVYFNTVFQDKGSTSAKYLDPLYWRAPNADNIKDKNLKINPPTNFYAEVCQNSPNSKLPLDFSINLMRSAYLGNDVGKGRSILPLGIRNCDAVELFLNGMPSIFPSMMVPYFEVEFDFPVKLPSQDPKDTRDYDRYFLNRPSLLRFLLGSKKIVEDVKTGKFILSEADKALIATKKVTTRGNKLQDAYNTGMEIFTSPQTLTNMEGLISTRSSRVVDVKPFLPPATLTGGSINLLNAGAEAFVHMKASVQFVIHDKARVSEFSEFFRVAHGTQDITVWLTYGWISPRSDTENDAYAKFVNETMLKKIAFNVMNASFSFDAYGQASVTLELVQQGKSFIDSVQLTYEDGEDFFATMKSIKKSVEALEQSKEVLGELDPGLAALKTVKDLQSGLGNFGPKSLSADERKNLSNLITSVQNGTALGSETKQTVLNGLFAAQQLADLYDNQQNRLRQISRSYASKKFQACLDPNSLDPFLPTEEKKEIISNGQTYTVFKNELIAEITQLSKPPTAKEVKKANGSSTTTGSRRIVSFGKIFSTFCLPPMLEMAASQNIEEVQVNFYQVNESCGPLSLHNVSEIPVDMDMFTEEFAAAAEQLGGEMMTLSHFIRTFNSRYLQDNRVIGYGLTSLYESYTREKPEEKAKTGQNFDFEKARKEWFDKYGSLKVPSLQIRMETIPKRNSTSNINLLDDLRNPDEKNASKIMKIHVYDAHLNPYDNIRQRILKNSVGAYLGAPQDKITTELLDARYDKQTKSAVVGDVTFITGSAHNPLAELVENSMPTLQIGANGSLITSISVSSKMDSQLGTALAVPTEKNFRSKNTLSPNGLVMQGTNLPLRVTDTSITMNTLGCPIADLYQHFYVNFGTGTTMDNIYAATGINHSFGVGKFETSWTMIPVDGYARFQGAKTIAEAVKEVQDNQEPKTKT